jgi:hypothetical protein
MRKINMNGYTRISKQAARKVWRDLAIDLALVPCNQVPDHMMGSTIHPSNEARKDPDWDLDRYARTFEVYNCNSGARDEGRYAAFYVKTKEV